MYNETIFHSVLLFETSSSDRKWCKTCTDRHHSHYDFKMPLPLNCERRLVPFSLCTALWDSFHQSHARTPLSLGSDWSTGFHRSTLVWILRFQGRKRSARLDFPSEGEPIKQVSTGLVLILFQSFSVSVSTTSPELVFTHTHTHTYTEKCISSRGSSSPNCVICSSGTRIPKCSACGLSVGMKFTCRVSSI